jgi:hypothetical protein
MRLIIVFFAAEFGVFLFTNIAIVHSLLNSALQNHREQRCARFRASDLPKGISIITVTSIFSGFYRGSLAE